MASPLDLLKRAKAALIEAIDAIEEDKYWVDPGPIGLAKSRWTIDLTFSPTAKTDGLIPNGKVAGRIIEILPDLEKLIGDLKRIDRDDWRPLEYRRPKKRKRRGK